MLRFTQCLATQAARCAIETSAARKQAAPGAPKRRKFQIENCKFHIENWRPARTPSCSFQFAVVPHTPPAHKKPRARSARPGGALKEFTGRFVAPRAASRS